MSAAPPTSAKGLRAKLSEHFGFDSFRPGQLEAVRSAMRGRDVIAVMPTGSGKSLCFQLPALELPGTAVVVSPLIALMKDQADHLKALGIPVAVVNSTLSAAERRHAEEEIAGGRVEFVYTTPEQLSKPAFREVLAKQKIDLFVVDEAHCLSQWGHDFRPDYLSLWEAIAAVGRPPVLALTATATEDILADIKSRLRIPDAEVVHAGFYRSNLRLSVLPVAGDGAKRRKLVELLGTQPGTGIVYAATVKAVDELTEHLDDAGVSVLGYHGRMPVKRRNEAQDRFMAGDVKALVATNAFGLGIDKPDIRFVIHYHLPGTLEAYYQEVGRAGRDGQPADGVLLWDPADLKLQRFFTGGRYPDEGDVVNAYHALGRAAAGKPESPTLAEVQVVSPVPKSRLKPCLELLAAKGLARAEPGGRYKVAIPNLTHDDIARAGEAYRERQERDRAKLARMAAFADARGCRWQAVLGYFDAPVPGDPVGSCGHCDNCR